MKIKAVLFDLDGTLLPIDMDVFAKVYYDELSAYMARYGYEPKKFVQSAWKGIYAIGSSDGTVNNKTVFWNTFADIYGEGEDVRQEKIFLEYFATEFDKIKEICSPTAMAAEIIKRVRDMGMKVILATNPVFPAIALEARVRWAGLEPEDFDWYSTYENSTHCKPNPMYYQELCRKFQLKPKECLMVGNDVDDDMSARKAGMNVFLLTDCLVNKRNEDISLYPNGSFEELLRYLDEI